MAKKIKMRDEINQRMLVIFFREMRFVKRAYTDPVRRRKFAFLS